MDVRYDEQVETDLVMGLSTNKKFYHCLKVLFFSILILNRNRSSR